MEFGVLLEGLGFRSKASGRFADSNREGPVSTVSRPENSASIPGILNPKPYTLQTLDPLSYKP